MALLTTSAESNVCVLQLKIRGVKNAKGQLMIGVFNSRESFPDHTKTDRSFIYQLEGKDPSQLNLKLSGFEQNKKYALAIYHDENSNKKLDKNFFGFPIEIYSFSNNARGIFGPPSFEEASFEFDSQEKRMTLILQ